MKKENVVIGQKVVPFQKTPDEFYGLENSNNWKNALVKNQNYLFVSSWDEDEETFILGCNENGQGDYFNACDFEPYEETTTIQQDKFKIYVTEQQVKILNAVDRYMSKYPFAKEGGSEYVSQSDDPQVGAVDLACELADIYCEYNTEE